MFMKKFFLLVVVSFFYVVTFAAHLKGGWIQYEYLSTDSTAQTNKYRITVRQYLLCTSTSQQVDQQIYLGIFDNASSALINTLTISLSGTEFPTKTTFDPCLNPKPTICYRIDTYVTTVDLPFNASGYVLAVQRCCRIAGIQNVSNSNSIGVTYSGYIPSTINGINYSKNSSPSFVQRDTAVICYNTKFTFDFSATDIDGDTLRYSFCNGLQGGGNGSGQQQPNPPTNPPYSSIPYAFPFSGLDPLGPSVTIDSLTGLISGTAPSVTGDYVIAVCVSEYRNGVLISTTKKEIHINVANCSISAAALNPSYITCNGYTMNFQNESASSNITSYLWKFGDVKNALKDTSSQPTPTYTYKDSGTFTLKLKVVATGGCQDSTTALVKVYPGFIPGFSVSGSCFLNTYQFTDTTHPGYGFVNSWHWNFGDTPLTTDTSNIQNPTYLYSTPGNRTIQLFVTNSKGCSSTVTQILNVSDKPQLILPFHDTLICSIDTLPLIANTNGGSISWTPVTRLINPNAATPLVYPKDTTVYYVTVNNNGCINKDSVKVNVLQYISVDAGLDSGICKTDSFHLHPTSYALSYKWIASSGVFVDSVKYPLVQPLINTKYYVTANLGKCQAIDSVYIKVAPYPFVAVSPDTTICFGSRVQLAASIVGSFYQWTPTTSLLNAKTLFPVAGPSKTTAYSILVTDTVGCPKAVTDTILITVVPPFNVFAGHDTSVVANQPVQLTASVSDTLNKTFLWTPATGLSNPFIANPVATLSSGTDSIKYIVTAISKEGCYAQDDIIVRVYNNSPDIILPSAFTPNGDNKNDVLKPIVVGLKSLDYFRIYNRWGQILFTTSEINKGWDGTANGSTQPSGTYVYMAQGTDYKGNIIFRKGTVVLIR